GFLTKMQLHLAANSMFLHTDVDRIKFVGTYLEGAAYDWFEPYLRDYLENDEIRDETSGMFQSYTSFVKRLQAVFGDPEAERTAERQLLNIRQKQAVNEYASRFNQIASRLEWDDAALMAQFYRGLKEEIKDEVARRDRPETLEALVAMATKIDSRNYERQMERKYGQVRLAKTTTGRSPQKKTDPYGPGPMELDAIE